MSNQFTYIKIHFGDFFLTVPRWIWNLKPSGGNSWHTSLGCNIIHIAPFVDLQTFSTLDPLWFYSKNLIFFRIECNFPFSEFIRPSEDKDYDWCSKSVNKRKRWIILHMTLSRGVVKDNQFEPHNKGYRVCELIDKSLWVSTFINEKLSPPMLLAYRSIVSSLFIYPSIHPSIHPLIHSTNTYLWSICHMSGTVLDLGTQQFLLCWIIDVHGTGYRAKRVSNIYLF